MQIKVIELLAEGFEEIEALTPVDYLRRAGIEVAAAAIGQTRTVRGARNIEVIADTTLAQWLQSEKAETWDAVILPGGMPGAANIAASPDARALIRGMSAAGKWVCAICAAPAVVLYPLDLLAGKKFTCFPGMEENVSGGKWSRDRVVIDENPRGGGIITSRSAGCAGEFAAVIIGRLAGDAAAEKVAQSVLLLSARA